MTLHQWHNSWLYSLMMYSILIFCIPVVPMTLLWGALAFCDWIDGPSYPHETCVETSRGATVCGDLVRW
jgi:hypothetical protein